MTSSRVFALLLVVAAFAPVQAQEDLGLGRMWTFENAPTEYLEAAYGFSPSQPWLDKTRLASLRFGGGCSSSFVSPQGLIMTNHHCVRDFVAKATPKDQDWLKNGYVAKTKADEVRLPGCEVEQLVSMKDITEAMNAGINDSMDAAAIAKQRKKNEDSIMEQASKANPDMKPQVVKLYQGGMFQLYIYKVWKDVRLVIAPHLQTAHFGGDPDNFTYPRYSIDFSFCRAYEDGKPVDSSKYYFRWSEKGAEPGELVFVTGNPGSTGRLKTYAQLEFKRDVEYPRTLDFLDREVDRLKKLSAESEEAEVANRARLLGLQNGQKNYRGTLAGLLDDSMMEQKRRAELRFRELVNKNPELSKKYGDAWDKIAKLSKDKARNSLYSPQGLDAIIGGVFIARISDPDAPSSTRKRLSTTIERLPMSDSAEEVAAFVKDLENAERILGKDDPYLQALRGPNGYKAFLMELVENTMLLKEDGVKKALAMSREQILASKDPAIVAGLKIIPLLIAAQKNAGKVEDMEAANEARIGRALFSIYGTKVPPDATFTLRLSDGVVKGYEYNGTIAPPRTSFFGLYGREREFGGEHPFDVPEVWLKRKNRIDMNKWVNFVSTNDIIGGNSGSPVINKDMEIVGLIFDGNIESLPCNYVFREERPRSVSVHVDAIAEALLKIYDADHIMRELRGQ